jgi:hypothetical protein
MLTQEEVEFMAFKLYVRGGMGENHNRDGIAVAGCW